MEQKKRLFFISLQTSKVVDVLCLEENVQMHSQMEEIG